MWKFHDLEECRQRCLREGCCPEEFLFPVLTSEMMTSVLMTRSIYWVFLYAQPLWNYLGRKLVLLLCMKWWMKQYFKGGIFISTPDVSCYLEGTPLMWHPLTLSLCSLHTIEGWERRDLCAIQFRNNQLDFLRSETPLCLSGVICQLNHNSSVGALMLGSYPSSVLPFLFYVNKSVIFLMFSTKNQVGFHLKWQFQIRFFWD